MKHLIQLTLLLGIISSLQAQQNHYYVNAGTGNGFRLWGNVDHYKIHMGNTSEYHYGPVTDYSIKSNMSNTTGRGWTWGTSGLSPIAALSKDGNFQIAGSFVSMGNVGLGLTNPQFRLSISDQDENISIGNNIFINGEGTTGRITNNAYRANTSWQIYDSTSNASTIEIRDRGVIEMYGTFTVGALDWRKMFGVDAPNDKVYFPRGNVGIGTENPIYKLHLQGSGEQVLSIWSDDSTPKLHFRKHNTSQDGMIVYHTNGRMGFHLDNAGAGNVDSNEFMTIVNSGQVGIGTTTPDEKLTVKGKIHAEEVKVDLSVPGPDYVFEEEYDLKSLEEIEAFIKSNKHLPEIPSAKEMEANGVELGTMNMLLLKKIEELTLYTLEQEREIENLKLRITNSSEIQPKAKSPVLPAGRQEPMAKQIEELTLENNSLRTDLEAYNLQLEALLQRIQKLENNSK